MGGALSAAILLAGVAAMAASLRMVIYGRGAARHWLSLCAGALGLAAGWAALRLAQPVTGVASTAECAVAARCALAALLLSCLIYASGAASVLGGWRLLAPLTRRRRQPR